MREVMIVDDESLVRVGFQAILDWTKYGYNVTGIFRNGQQAWHSIQAEGPPDVLLTDIKMPEMDGLELISKIRENYKDVNIIILSSHNEFDYLRASISLNVQDYILKHTFDPEDLIGILNKLEYKKCEPERTVEHKVSDVEFEKNSLLKESRSVTNELDKRLTNLKIDRYTNLVNDWGINTSKGYWIAIQPFPKEQYLDTEIMALSYLLRELVHSLDMFQYIGFDQDLFHILCILDFDTPNLNELFLKNWIDTVLQKLDVSIVIGVSEKNELSEDIPKSRMQAEMATGGSFYFGKGIYYFDKKNTMNRISVVEWARLKENVLDLLGQYELSSVINWMEDKGGELADRNIHIADAVHFLQMVFRTFLESRVTTFIVNKQDIEGEVRKGLLSYETVISNSVPIWDDLLQATSHLMKEQEQSFLKESKKVWAKDVIQFIKQHYTDPIKLEDVARFANFNENYFSQLFHREIGVTFLEYITRLRIEEAIKLLKETRLSTAEIGYRIGYPNSNYFVRVFKKVTGMTISEFRSNSTINMTRINIWDV